MNKIKVLNLYAGIGGNRKLWPNDEIEVTAVENNPEIAKIYKDFFPNDKIVVADAHQYLLDHYKEFNFIWSSPPCQSHSVTNFFSNGQGIIRYPDIGQLYGEIIFLKTWFKGKWVVENVKPYYEPLIKPYYASRHCFWSNFPIPNKDYETDIGTMNKNASKIARRKAIIREAQIPELIDLHGLEDFKAKNKRQLLRNCVNPKLGLYIFNLAFKESQTTLQKLNEAREE